jgi:hypothetical protein
MELADRHMSDRKRFDASQHSKAIKKHFELLEKLRIAPASKQASIAGESVSLAPAFALAWREQEQLHEKHAKELGRKYAPHPLPSHPGFERLAINYERDKRYAETIAICKEAKRHGWYGDWEKRIERCEKKLGKQIVS